MNITLFCFILFWLLCIFIFARMLYTARRKAKTNREMFTNLNNLVKQQIEEKQETARRRYVTKSIKEEVLKRDKCCCQICGISKKYLDNLLPGLGDYLLLEIDHIIPVANGGDGKSVDNLQVLCWRCNRKKGRNKTNADVNASRDYGLDVLLKNKLRQNKQKNMSHDEK